MIVKQSCLTGVLKFTAEYDIEGIPDRTIPHGKYGAKYRVEKLTVTLVSSSAYSEDPLSISSLKLNLKVHHVTIGGSRLKQNGHPGNMPCREEFYTERALPEWVASLTSQLMWDAKRL